MTFIDDAKKPRREFPQCSGVVPKDVSAITPVDTASEFLLHLCSCLGKAPMVIK